jgi:hypothetical protein
LHGISPQKRTIKISSNPVIQGETNMAESSADALQQKFLKALCQPRPAPKPPDTAIPAAANPAIAYCLQAYTNALQAALREDESHFRATDAAKAAYRSAMPPLTGSRNIRDFVACIAHAMAINALDGREGARLLYAAQVASAAQSAQRRIKAKSSAITAPQPPQNQQLPNTEFPVNQAQ